jgi:hypothetical protein
MLEHPSAFGLVGLVAWRERCGGPEVVVVVVVVVVLGMQLEM